MSKRYEVTSPYPVLGHPTGERFTADLSPQQEARLIAARQIRPVKAKKAPKRNTDQEE